MTVRKLTISLPEELDRTVRIAASAAGLSVSAWLAQAAAQVAVEQAIIADGRAALEEFVAENGPITTHEDQDVWVARVLSDTDTGAGEHRAAS
jgi:predicted transcriptional regulator